MYKCDEQDTVLPCEISVVIDGREKSEETSSNNEGESSNPPAAGRYADDEEWHCIRDSIVDMFRQFPTTKDEDFSTLRVEFSRQEFRSADILTIHLQVSTLYV